VPPKQTEPAASNKVALFESGLKLRVTGGRHVGAVSSALGESQIIGSSLDADLVLTDPGVCAHHVRIGASRLGLELVVLDGTVRADGGLLGPGKTVITQFPATIEIGEAKIEIAREAAFERKKVASFLSAGAVAVISLIALTDWYWSAGNPGRAPGQEPSTMNTAAQAGHGSLPGPEVTSAAADALRQHLLSQNITTIDVKAGSGIVIAAGSMVPEREAEWQSAQMWFDETYGQKILLKTDVVLIAAAPVKAPVTIQSVWLGKAPYLIDGEGRKYWVGSVLKGGWVLEKVEEGRVLVSKDEQLLILRY